MRRSILCILVLVFALTASATVASAQAAPAFQLGFKALADQIPDIVGTPLENEHFNLSNGNSEQHTTKGLMVWRKADNWTAFTNGYMTWINGPNGVQSRLNTERFPWEAPAPATSAPAPTATTPQDNNQGIQLGSPVVFRNPGADQVGVLVTNTSNLVKSFTVKATFKTGDTISATAVGAVNDLRPGEVRAALLLATSPIPTTLDSVTANVDTMVNEAASTPGADAAAKIKFGQPTLNSVAGLSTIDVEVSNGDSQPHSFTAQAVLTKGGQLVGVAEGAVNDLAPSATKTATLMVTGGVGDKVVLTVDTMVQ